MIAISLEDEYEPKRTTWQDLDDDVRAHSGVLRVRMADLRSLSGFTRLKVHVVAAISNKLHSIGLDHLPADLPRAWDQHVVVFKSGSEAGAVINAVRNGTSSEEAERVLRRLNMSDLIKEDGQDDAKIAALVEKADQLENLLEDFRDILNT